MQDADAFLSPEPIRFMYDSDEDHVRAWLAWAKGTPGGWRARLADKHDVLEGDAADTGDRPAGQKRRFLVRHVEVPSPCCGAEVLVDPLSGYGGQGMCSTCGTMLMRQVQSWKQSDSLGSD
jgi:hypothetical protein